MKASSHRVVVIGGGFGGLSAVRALRHAPVDVTLIDRGNHHLFQPLLYQVATGILAEGEIAPPLRGVLSGQRNAVVELAEVREIDVEARQLSVLRFDGDRGSVGYDTLIVAAGATHSYFGHDEWADFAPGLKSLEDARRVRAKVLGAFEAAVESDDEAERKAQLTFVVVGAGPTGLELTGQIAQLSQFVLRRDFKAIDTAGARIVLVEAGPHVLAPFDPKLRRYAASELVRMGVEMRLETRATGIDADGIELTGADGATERIAARTVLWAAGVHASSLGAKLGEATGAEVDRAGRVAVGPDCSLPGHPEVFAIGDMVRLDGLPGVAQPAIQEGAYVAGVIRARLRGDEPPAPFKYFDKGMMAVVGRRRAVADAFGVKLRGHLAMFVWAVVHLAFLVGWRNRVGAVLRWLASILGRHRGERVIDTRYPPDPS